MTGFYLDNSKKSGLFIVTILFCFFVLLSFVGFHFVGTYLLPSFRILWNVIGILQE